jgi:hypothetical protein
VKGTETMAVVTAQSATTLNVGMMDWTVRVLHGTIIKKNKKKYTCKYLL